MSHAERKTQTVSLLQDLGLKEYEARCFMALTQVPAATATDVSDLTEVPRTRIYDAVRVLEAKGLVEVQHSSPQRFRAVSIDEGVETLRRHYDDQIDALKRNLERLDMETERDDPDRLQEVWSLKGSAGIQSRMFDRLENADSEVVLLIVDEDLLTEALFDRLRDAVDRGVDVFVGGKTDASIARLESELSLVDVFETDFDWLVGPEDEDEVAIGRILLTDRSSLLISSFYPQSGHADPTEQAIFATGLENGIVVLTRRLISSGLLPMANPGS